MNLQAISRVLKTVRDEGRLALLETEGAAILQAMGLSTPGHVLISGSREAASVKLFKGERAVVKVISPEILHKTEVGGVAIVANNTQAITSAIAEMERKFKGLRVDGYTINEFVPFSPAMGREILIGMRWTEDFGPVVTFGPGGIYAEFLAKHFKAGEDVAILSPRTASPEVLDKALNKVAVSEIVFGGYRKQKELVSREEVKRVLESFLKATTLLIEEGVTEFEVNPFVATDRGLVALDVLIKLGGHPKSLQTPKRPIQKIKQLLEPKSAAIIGVSEKMNPGHIILNNLLQQGFDKDEIYIVKPGSKEIEGCRCYPDIASLPKKVDLFILSVSAAQVPEVVTATIENQKAESMIVIPGGLEEKQGTENIVARMKAVLAQSRETSWGGPVINGGNCLGLRSLPGHYNTLFIPEHKLPMPKGTVAPVVLLSQSGAFAITKMSKLSMINPKFSITLGNQTDLTIGDYMEYLKDDPELDIFAVYVEGFRPLDGLKFLEAAKELKKRGKTVILYRAGRTSAGAKASASHTASIAGDYAVTRELSKQAGVVVAESLADFEDLIKLFTFLDKKEVKGRRLGIVSNAGFECVAAADSLGSFELVQFGEKTHQRLAEVFKQSRIEEIVDVHNPLDLTPMAGDQAYEESTRALLEDPGIDIVMMGCVPLSGALNTLAAGSGHREDVTAETSVASRLGKLKEQYKKAWVAVVDSGSIYDPLAAELERYQVPVFRTADQALRLFNEYVAVKA